MAGLGDYNAREADRLGMAKNALERCVEGRKDG